MESRVECARPGDAAEAYLRLLAEAELRRAAALPHPSWLDEHYRQVGEAPGTAGLIRVAAVAHALTFVGGLDRATAGRVLHEFTGALRARGLSYQTATLPPSASSAQAESPERMPAHASISFRAAPVAARIPAELDGGAGHVHLLTLTIGPGLAVITMAFTPAWPQPGEEVAGQPSFPPFGGSGAVDDLGRRYQLTFSGADAPWWPGGALYLAPVPPPTIRWLEIPTSPGAPAVRVAVGSRPAGVRTSAGPLPPTPAGELLLDAVAQTLLGAGPMPGAAGRQLAISLADVVAALEAVRALPRASPAAARLAALCQRRGIEVRGELRTRAAAAGLSEPWANALAHGDHQDGLVDLAPVAAVLPEIDGARFVLAGLTSGEGSARLNVFSWGWRPRPRTFRLDQPLSWWARDNAGRWHLGRVAPADGPHFHLELVPPLDPAATELEVMLTGASSRVSATVPLAWAGR